MSEVSSESGEEINFDSTHRSKRKRKISSKLLQNTDISKSVSKRPLTKESVSKCTISAAPSISTEPSSSSPSVSINTALPSSIPKFQAHYSAQAEEYIFKTLFFKKIMLKKVVDRNNLYLLLHDELSEKFPELHYVKKSADQTRARKLKEHVRKRLQLVKSIRDDGGTNTSAFGEDRVQGYEYCKIF